MTECTKRKHKNIEITREVNRVVVDIHMRKNKVLLFVLSFWLLAWLVLAKIIFEAITLNVVEKNGLLYVGFSCIWLMQGGLASYCLLWNLKGKEKIIFDGRELSHAKSLGYFSVTKKYDYAGVTGFRIRQLMLRSGVELPGRSEGVIYFTCWGRECFFGVGINDVEAKYVIDNLKFYESA